MPVKLTIWLSPTSDQRYDFEFDAQEIRVGRDPGSDVQLPFSFVSGDHFTIIEEGNSYLIADNDSTNGTVVNGTRLAAHAYNPIKAGDIVTVGDLMMQIAVISEVENTLSLEESSEEVRKMVWEALNLKGKDRTAQLEVVGGDGRGVSIEIGEDQHRVVIGSSVGVQMRIDDGQCHAEHLEVVRIGQGFVAKPLNAQLSKINGQPVVDPVALGKQARIQIGGTQIRFQDPLQEYLEELARLPDDTHKGNVGDSVLSTQQIDNINYDAEAEPGPDFGPPDRPPLPGSPRLRGRTSSRINTVEQDEDSSNWGTFEYLVVGVTLTVVLGGLVGILILFNVIRV